MKKYYEVVDEVMGTIYSGTLEECNTYVDTHWKEYTGLYVFDPIEVEVID
jgi:hypothetical protein